MLMQPVQAVISISGRPITAVNVLDFDGRRQEGKTLAAPGGRFSIDTGKEHTMYYEVVFGQERQ